jgi:hypothetical protein
VPLVSHETALRSPAINQRSVLDLIHLPAGSLDHLRPRRTLSRREWQRFLAVRLTSAQARPMEPLLTPGSIAVIDRHYNSLAPAIPHGPIYMPLKSTTPLPFAMRAMKPIASSSAPARSIPASKCSGSPPTNRPPPASSAGSVSPSLNYELRAL